MHDQSMRFATCGHSPPSFRLAFLGESGRAHSPKLALANPPYPWKQRHFRRFATQKSYVWPGPYRKYALVILCTWSHCTLSHEWHICARRKMLFRCWQAETVARPYRTVMQVRHTVLAKSAWLMVNARLTSARLREESLYLICAVT